MLMNEDEFDLCKTLHQKSQVQTPSHLSMPLTIRSKRKEEEQQKRRQLLYLGSPNNNNK